MRAGFLAVLFVAATAAAAAAKSICVDAHFAYDAHPLNRHDIFIRSATGKNRPAIRLRTDCSDLDPSAAIKVHAAFGCVGIDDVVIATSADGGREHCIVTRAYPYVPEKGDIAPAKGGRKG